MKMVDFQLNWVWSGYIKNAVFLEKTAILREKKLEPVCILAMGHLYAKDEIWFCLIFVDSYS